MYYVTCDGFPLLDWRDDDLILTSPRVKLEVNTVGEGSFTIYNNHPHYDKLKKLKSVFEIKDENSVIFRGRATGDSIDFDHGMAVDLEGAMAFFNDSVVRPFHLPDDFSENADYIAAAESGNVIEFFLGWLIDNHNSQVEDFQKMKLGNVTVRDPNNYITRSNSDYASTWATLKDKLFDSSLAGYLCVRYETDGTYIDYLEDFTEVNKQEIAFGENILDLKTATEASGTYSAIIPIGALGLTIEGVADGDITEDLVKSGDTIYSKSAVAEYGWIYAPTSETTWDDVTEESNLVKKGGEWLLNGGMLLSHGIEVTGVDLHFSDAQIESLRIYKNVNVRSAPHNLTEQFSLTKLEIELLEPQNTKIAIGKTIVPLSERTIKQEEEVRKKYSKLSKNDEEIKMEVQDFGSKLGQTLRIGADGVTITNAAGETLTIDGGQIDATKIKAQDLDATKINAGDLVLTGTLSWADFSDETKASSLTLDANGLVCTGAGGQVTISGGQIDASTINAAQLDASKINAGDLNMSGVLSWGDFSDDAKDDVLKDTTEAAKNDITQTVIPELDDKIQASQDRADDAYDLAEDAQGTAEDAMGAAGDAVEKLGAWTYKGSTKIDGSMIQTGTVRASTLEGGTVKILASNGSEVGFMQAQTTSNLGLTLQSNTALRLISSNQTLYLTNGVIQMQLLTDGRLPLTGCSSLHPSGSTSAYLGHDEKGKWQALYAYTGTIQTSDRNEKHSIELLPEKYLYFFDLWDVYRFKLNTGTSDRYHVGFVAQDIEEDMEETNIDSKEFGGFVKSIGENGNEIYSLRYEEFIGILVAKVKQLEKRIQKLEETNA
jgi:hypothetical protein